MPPCRGGHGHFRPKRAEYAAVGQQHESFEIEPRRFAAHRSPLDLNGPPVQLRWQGPRDARRPTKIKRKLSSDQSLRLKSLDQTIGRLEIGIQSQGLASVMVRKLVCPSKRLRLCAVVIDLRIGRIDRDRFCEVLYCTSKILQTGLRKAAGVVQTVDVCVGVSNAQPGCAYLNRLFMFAKFIQGKTQIAVSASIGSVGLNCGSIFLDRLFPIVFSSQCESRVRVFLGAKRRTGSNSAPCGDHQRTAALITKRCRTSI